MVDPTMSLIPYETRQSATCQNGIKLPLSYKLITVLLKDTLLLSPILVEDPAIGLF